MQGSSFCCYCNNLGWIYITIVCPYTKCSPCSNGRFRLMLTTQRLWVWRWVRAVSVILMYTGNICSPSDSRHLLFRISSCGPLSVMNLFNNTYFVIMYWILLNGAIFSAFGTNNSITSQEYDYAVEGADKRLSSATSLAVSSADKCRLLYEKNKSDGRTVDEGGTPREPPRCWQWMH